MLIVSLSLPTIVEYRLLKSEVDGHAVGNRVSVIRCNGVAGGGCAIGKDVSEQGGFIIRSVVNGDHASRAHRALADGQIGKLVVHGVKPGIINRFAFARIDAVYTVDAEFIHIAGGNNT